MTSVYTKTWSHPLVEGLEGVLALDVAEEHKHAIQHGVKVRIVALAVTLHEIREVARLRCTALLIVATGLRDLE
jgi:hypothetical protein